MFNTTVNSTRPGLPALYQGISNSFSINWSTVNWNDNLLMPLYSGLAARLYLATLGENIPGTIAEQANFWVRHYRPNGTASYFIDSVKQLESNTGVCEGLFDICMVLDGSGSIGAPGFVQAKSFIRQLVNSFSLETTRQAFVVYSENAATVFDFQHNMTSAELNETIDQLPYPAQNTDTPAGLNRAVDLYNDSPKRPGGVPRIVATFTDGNHNRGNLPTAVSRMRNANLTSFAIGIGSQIDNSELVMIALMDPSKVFHVTNYAAFEEFVYQMTTYVCEVPLEPEMGVMQNGTLKNGERRYFKFDIPEGGLSLQIFPSFWYLSGWYSFSNPTPNSALHDGSLDCGGFYLTPSFDSSTLYLGVKNEAEETMTYAFTPIGGSSDGFDPSICYGTTTTRTTTTTPRPDPTFDCSNKTDGFYPSPYACDQYFGCLGGDTFEFVCPPPYHFNPEHKVCDFPEVVQCDLDCSAKEDGFYPHPDYCSLYLRCLEGDGAVLECPSPLLFDPVGLICNFPHLVNCTNSL